MYPVRRVVERPRGPAVRIPRSRFRSHLPDAGIVDDVRPLGGGGVVQCQNENGDQHRGPPSLVVLSQGRNDALRRVRGYYFISDLGSVESTAGALVEKIHAARIDPEDWSPRTVDIYTDGTKFVALAASSSGGTLTNCSGLTATLICSGTSTP